MMGYKINAGDLIVWKKEDFTADKKVGDICLVTSIDEIYSSQHVMMKSVNGCSCNPFGEAYTNVVNALSLGKIEIHQRILKSELKKQ